MIFQRSAFLVGSAAAVAAGISSAIAGDVWKAVLYGGVCGWWLGVWFVVERHR